MLHRELVYTNYEYNEKKVSCKNPDNQSGLRSKIQLCKFEYHFILMDHRILNKGYSKLTKSNFETLSQIVNDSSLFSNLTFNIITHSLPKEVTCNGNDVTNNALFANPFNKRHYN